MDRLSMTDFGRRVATLRAAECLLGGRGGFFFFFPFAKLFLSRATSAFIWGEGIAQSLVTHLLTPLLFWLMSMRTVVVP